MITIALPKGRLFDKTSKILARCGYHLTLGERQLVAEEPRGEIRAILVKNSDLPTYVHHGIAGLGVCGSDVIYESGHEFFELLSLPFGGTRICLAGKKDESPDSRNAAVLRVATKFTRFTRDAFHQRGIPVDVIRLDGSVELAPVLGLAPYIVDLVETGSTLVAHNLEVKETLGNTDVRLIANPAFYKYHFDRVNRFVSTLQEALKAEAGEG
ncbi:ATP phosphoribosyltransferase [Alkalispirochaeta americana]|uniref:ATP phosphoribosyltransferase n=1 Tax=Alkalispirochaeta americana TaxID=159291 RepID=A0A1N6WI70_9SPIO|nr:ATP phosphoribosyltransferase [Alkalispirochaeta americana]SIQ89765.1 ATP phosphoribosyltransferase [Alkalispirochaeta americana]